MNNTQKVILFTSYTLSAYFLFGTSVKMYSDRLIKFPNKLFHPTDLLNLPIMLISGFSVIKLTLKSIELLEKLE